MELLKELTEKAKELEKQLEETRNKAYALNLQQRLQYYQIAVKFNNANRYSGLCLDVNLYLQYNARNKADIGNVITVIKDEYPDVIFHINIVDFLPSNIHSHENTNTLIQVFTSHMNTHRENDKGLDRFFKVMVTYPTAVYYFGVNFVVECGINNGKLNIHINTKNGEIVNKRWS